MAIQQVDGALSIVIKGKEYLLMPITRGGNIENDAVTIDALADNDEILIWDASDKSTAKKTTWVEVKQSVRESIPILYPQIVVSVSTGSSVTCSNGGTTKTAQAVGGVATFEVTEYGAWTVKASLSGQESSSEVIQVDAVKKYPVTLHYASVFGVCWDPLNPSTALARLTQSSDPNGFVTVNISTEPSPAVGTGSGSSPFDRYAPWSQMDEYNIVNGTVGPCKGDAGFSRGRDTMVYIPEFWFKFMETGGKRYFYIADKPKDGFGLHPGSGKYLSRYSMSEDGMSKTGVAPLTEITRGEAREKARAKGEKWSQYDYITWNAVWLLYLVEFADWDCQKKIGRGRVDMTWSDGKADNGGTDTMSYHTGRAAGEDGKTCIQYRHLENIWGNVFYWIDGININVFDVYICTDHKLYDDDTDVGYECIYTTDINDDGGYISAIASPPENAPWAFLPSGISGSETTYIPDYGYYWGESEEWYLPCGGGGWYDRSDAGLFQFGADYLSDETGSSDGARLLFNP